MTSFDWQNPFPPRAGRCSRANVVATSQPLAAQAGLAVLARGGNAVDAAIAAAAVIALTEPCSNGPGLGQLRDRLGRPPAAWPEFERHGAGGVDARLFPPQARRRPGEEPAVRAGTR